MQHNLLMNVIQMMKHIPSVLPSRKLFGRAAGTLCESPGCAMNNCLRDELLRDTDVSESTLDTLMNGFAGWGWFIRGN